jgi:hypothetical protein
MNIGFWLFGNQLWCHIRCFLLRNERYAWPNIILIIAHNHVITKCRLCRCRHVGICLCSSIRLFLSVSCSLFSLLVNVRMLIIWCSLSISQLISSTTLVVISIYCVCIRMAKCQTQIVFIILVTNGQQSNVNYCQLDKWCMVL